jgi:hypothetical protein
VTPRCRIPESQLLFQRAAVFAAGALLFTLSGCSTHQRPEAGTLDDFTRWHKSARAQGWRRPLMAWLQLQVQRAEAAGDAEAAAALRRRMSIVEQGGAPG